MNGNLNLIEIFKNCPKGTKLYSPIYGEVEFMWINNKYSQICVLVTYEDGQKYLTHFHGDGRFSNDFSEATCCIFPSKDQLDWSKWVCPKLKKKKFVSKTMKPFDKVIVRIDSSDGHLWYSDYVSTSCERIKFIL